MSQQIDQRLLGELSDRELLEVLAREIRPPYIEVPHELLAENTWFQGQLRPSAGSFAVIDLRGSVGPGGFLRLEAWWNGNFKCGEIPLRLILAPSLEQGVPR